MEEILTERDILTAKNGNLTAYMNMVTYTTLKCFIKVLKDMRYYHIFRCSVGHYNGGPLGERLPVMFPVVDYPMIGAIKMFAVRSDPKNNRFYYNQSLSDTVLTLSHEIHFDSFFLKFEDKQEAIKMAVSAIINILLFQCLQQFLASVNIEEIGRSIYNLACKKILGDSFVEEVNSPISEKAFLHKKILDSIDPEMKKILANSYYGSYGVNYYQNNMNFDRPIISYTNGSTTVNQYGDIIVNPYGNITDNHY